MTNVGNNPAQIMQSITQYAPGYDPSRPQLYRGLGGHSTSNLDREFYGNRNAWIATPGPRRLEPLSEIMTWILEHVWPDVPNRRNSVIFSTDEEYASKFGDCHVVIPIEDGECVYYSGYDMWGIEQYEHGVSPYGMVKMASEMYEFDSLEGVKAFIEKGIEFDEFIELVLKQQSSVLSYMASKLEKTWSGSILKTCQAMYDKDLMTKYGKVIEIKKYPDIRKKEQNTKFGFEGWTHNKCLLVPNDVWMQIF